METKDYLMIGLGILGWLWAIIQFGLSRKYQKSDKVIEKKFEVYSNFMNQMDEMSLNLRKDPNATYGISTEFMTELLSKDEERMNNALLKLNEKLLETTKNSLQPMMIINSELNKLKLVASGKLLLKINEYKHLVNDYTNEFQTVLNNLSISNNIDDNLQEFQSIGQIGRNTKMSELWREIENLMRDEINYCKQW